MTARTLKANDFIDEFKRNKNLLIVDLRTPAEVASERLDNCIHLPIDELNETALKQHIENKSMTADEPVYLLCQSGARANMAVAKLNKCDDISFVVLEGGLNALKQHGIDIKNDDSRNIISLERQVRISAGLLILLTSMLGFIVHPMFYILTALIGAGLTFAGITDICMMGMVLARMPWNNLPRQKPV